MPPLALQHHEHYPVDRARVDACVEAISHQGCQAVHDIIERLEQGRPEPFTAVLNPAERDQVLSELKDVMAVYTNCRTP